MQMWKFYQKYLYLNPKNNIVSLIYVDVITHIFNHQTCVFYMLKKYPHFISCCLNKSSKTLMPYFPSKADYQSRLKEFTACDHRLTHFYLEKRKCSCYFCIILLDLKKKNNILLLLLVDEGERRTAAIMPECILQQPTLHAGRLTLHGFSSSSTAEWVGSIPNLFSEHPPSPLTSPRIHKVWH